MYEIVPVAMKRSVVKLDAKKAKAKVERWNGIALSAAKQSKRSIQPEVTEVMTFKQALEYAGKLDKLLLPYECAEGMEKTRKVIEEIGHGESVGNGIRKLMERAVPQGTPESMIVKVHETFTEHYKKHCADKTRPYDGIKELIENIRNAGVYTAVVSNKADYGVQTLCKDYFPGLFDYAVGEREGIRRKPYPDSVNEVLRQFDVDRTQAVYVGDSEVDVQTAANAGMDVCMVGWGFI